MKSLLAQHGLKARKDWIGYSSAAERHKEKRWRLLFAIGICGLATRAETHRVAATARLIFVGRRGKK